MVVDVRRTTISHHTFRDLPGFLLPGDALVLNETKVLPARLEAKKPTGGGVELLFLRDLGPDRGRRVGGPGQAEQTPQARTRALGRWGSAGAGREPRRRALGRLCPRRTRPAGSQRQDAAPALHPSHARDGEPLPDRLRAQRRVRRRANGRLPLYGEGSGRGGACRSEDRQDHVARRGGDVHAREDREARGAQDARRTLQRAAGGGADRRGAHGG